MDQIKDYLQSEAIYKMAGTGVGFVCDLLAPTQMADGTFNDQQSSQSSVPVQPDFTGQYKILPHYDFNNQQCMR